MTPTATEAKLFLSWCHRDLELKQDLLERLEPNLAILDGLKFFWWEDAHLQIGEEWRRDILRRVGECDYGLLLLSPGFFASDFITKEELPHFVGAAAVKGALPVLLRIVPLDGSRTLHGTEHHQIFTERGKSYAELSGSSRDMFAVNLASEIAARILDRGWRPL